MRRAVAAGSAIGVLAICVLATAASLSAARDTSAMGAERVQVEMRQSGCTVEPNTGLAPGPTVFVASNRSRRARRFAIAGRRTSFLEPGRTAKLVAQLHTGRVRYTCSASGSPRSVHTGAITVVRPPAIARIGIRDGKFYDRVTGVPFVPRGSNYIRLALQQDPAGLTRAWHSTFDVGRYNARRAEAALARMEASGYNVVRVFFNGVCLHFCLGDEATGGLRLAYLENVADFVRRAKAHGVQVMLTIDTVPEGTTWIAKVRSNQAYDGFQQWFLPAESVAAFRDYFTVLVGALLDAGMPADGVFAYSLINEAFMDGDKPPFSLRSGTRTTANGQTYDLSSATERRRMLEDGLVYWADVMVDAIHRVVPTSLVTMGFFHSHEPNPARRGDPRLIYTNEFLQRSRVDFFDFHPYPDDELTFPQFMENYGITGSEAKPVVMGEYGGSRRAYRTAEEAAGALQHWQFESCAWGFDGWLLWTWDTDEQSALWNALSSGGVIEQALAPRRRIDPCAPAS
jgi:cellulase (glycosyl hydrolase family 5)